MALAWGSRDSVPQHVRHVAAEEVDVSDERDESKTVFAGLLVTGHVLMILAIVVEVVGICCASRGKRVAQDMDVAGSPKSLRSSI